MIKHLQNSDITKVTHGIIVQGCNAQGVMGSGVAKQLRAKYPDIFMDYLSGLQEYKEESISPLGAVFLSEITSNLVIANAITQEFYGRDGQQYVSYQALEHAFKCVAGRASDMDLPVHLPYLIGAGLGGGDEKIILEIINKTLYNTDCTLHYWKQ